MNILLSLIDYKYILLARDFWFVYITYHACYVRTDFFG